MKKNNPSLIRKALPVSIRRLLVRLTRWPPVGRVNFHDLRRLEPISRSWGGDRGTPIDRYYIEKFLVNHIDDVKGHVLEIGGNNYTRKFNSGKVSQSDVLHVVEGNPLATIVADLSDAPEIPDKVFDCIICTQTLQFIPEVQAAVRTLHRILRPGGILLATAATISQLDLDENSEWGDYWRFTSHGFLHLFKKVFKPGQIEAAAYGNVLTATAFLQGLAFEELHPDELEYFDPAYETVVAARAIKEIDEA